VRGPLTSEYAQAPKATLGETSKLDHWRTWKAL